MNRSYQQMSDLPYQAPMYHTGNYQQTPNRMPVPDVHYNPDMSYPQMPPTVGNWPPYQIQRPSHNEELVSPLANNAKYPYPGQGPIAQSQGMSHQYSAVPYMMQNVAPGTQIPRSLENNGALDVRPETQSEIQLDHAFLGPQRPPATAASMSQAAKRPPVHVGTEGSGAHAPSVSHEAEAPEIVSSRGPISVSVQPQSKLGSTSSSELSANACGVCGKVFQKPYNLKSHMKTHSTERPFKCLFCPKTFARSHDRKRHENLHGGQKNFKCEGYLRNGITKWGCGKKFARSDALSRHFRTETGYLCIKQFMDEEKEREALGDARHDLLFPPPQMHAAPASSLYYAQQPLQQAPQQQPQQPQQPQQHYQANTAIRSYDLLSYAPPQILLPPLLRH